MFDEHAYFSKIMRYNTLHDNNAGRLTLRLQLRFFILCFKLSLRNAVITGSSDKDPLADNANICTIISSSLHNIAVSVFYAY